MMFFDKCQFFLYTSCIYPYYFMNVDNNFSFSFLEKQWCTDDCTVIWWHPQLALWSAWEILFKPQKEAFLAAVKLSKLHNAKILIWISNYQSHSRILSLQVPRTWRMRLMDLPDEIRSPYHSYLSNEDHLLLEDIEVVFQDTANGLVKSLVSSKKISERARSCIKNVLLDTKNWWKALCWGTALGFLKLTQKMNRHATCILWCFWAEEHCAHTDIVKWIVAAHIYLWFTQRINFAYFDHEKASIPLHKTACEIVI